MECMKIKTPSREENLEHLKDCFFNNFKETNDSLLNYFISLSWANGYNLVLDACWKVVNKLEEWENCEIE